MELSRIDCQYVDLEVTATLRDGTAATLTGVDVAILPYRTRPTAATAWTASTYAAGVATVLISGPDAGGVPNALVVPDGGGELWVRVVDAPEVDAARVAFISVD